MLKHHGGIDWDTYYDWPIAYKEWYIVRLRKEIEKTGGNPDEAAGPTTPQRRINFAQLQKAFSGAGDDR